MIIEVYKYILEKDFFNELKLEESELFWEYCYYCMLVLKVLFFILFVVLFWEYGFFLEIYNLLVLWVFLRLVDVMELFKVSFLDICVRDIVVEWMEVFIDDELCDYFF